MANKQTTLELSRITDNELIAWTDDFSRYCVFARGSDDPAVGETLKRKKTSSSGTSYYELVRTEDTAVYPLDSLAPIERDPRVVTSGLPDKDQIENIHEVDRLVHAIYRARSRADNVEANCIANAAQLFESLRELDPSHDFYLVRGVVGYPAENKERMQRMQEHSKVLSQPKPALGATGEPIRGDVHWWVEAWASEIQFTLDIASLARGSENDPLLAANPHPREYHIAEINPPHGLEFGNRTVPEG